MSLCALVNQKSAGQSSECSLRGKQFEMKVCGLAFEKSPRARAAKSDDANEICEIAETQTTYITDELN